jgi:hypothetical protein
VGHRSTSGTQLKNKLQIVHYPWKLSAKHRRLYAVCTCWEPDHLCSAQRDALWKKKQTTLKNYPLDTGFTYKIHNTGIILWKTPRTQHWISRSPSVCWAIRMLLVDNMAWPHVFVPLDIFIRSVRCQWIYKNPDDLAVTPPIQEILRALMQIPLLLVYLILMGLRISITLD